MKKENTVVQWSSLAQYQKGDKVMFKGEVYVIGETSIGIPPQKTFLQWFIGHGWKKYTLMLVVGIFLMTAFIVTLPQSLEDNSTLLMFFIGLIPLGFLVLTIWHMILIFRRQR